MTVRLNQGLPWVRPISMETVMTKRFFSARNLLFSASLSLFTLGLLPVPAAFAQDGPVHMQTRLSGPEIQGRDPQGMALFNATEESRTFVVSVSHVPPEEGPLNVTVVHDGTGSVVGQIALNRGGAGQLVLSTRAGDSVPRIEKGDIVIVSGTDEARSADPPPTGDDARIETGVF